MNESKVKSLPAREDVKLDDTWDLASLFHSDSMWEESLAAWEKRIPEYDSFVGTLTTGAARLAACLAFGLEMEREGDRLGSALGEVRPNSVREHVARVVRAAENRLRALGF